VFPVFGQPKLDGLRCIVTREGAFSRQWKPFVTLDHVRKAAQPLFDRYPKLMALDGEMYSHNLKNKFEEIVSIVKQPKATAEDIEKCKKNIQYHVYDIIYKTNPPFIVRQAKMTEMLFMLFQNIEADMPGAEEGEYIQYVETLPLDNQEEMDSTYKQYIAEGYEGQMIRAFDSPYQHKRTKDLLKRKDFHDAEYEIVGYKDGKGSREGCIILRLAMPDGKEFDSVPVGGIEYQKKLWNHREELLGLQATVKYQNLSSDGIPRFNNTVKIRTRDLEEVKF
jgi:DNA ligase-1